MDNHQELRSFIQASSEYSRSNAEVGAGEIERSLQIISLSAGLIDATSPDGNQFFVALHDFMSSVDYRSMLVWSAVSALQKACCNKKTKETLIHTYKFIPVLTRFLVNNHISEKQQKLLQVLAELTYGVKITWQEAHLPELVGSLVQIIMGAESEHTHLALVVLVNLCYRNLPVLYVLMRRVDMSKFIKSVTKMNANPAVQMQVCKMLVILEEIKGNLPDEIIMKCVDIAFRCLTESFQRRDGATMRQTVDFFKDLNEQRHIKNVICRYSKSFEDTKRLTALLEMNNTPDEIATDCMTALLEFLPYPFKMNFLKTVRLIPNLLDLVLPWIPREGTCVPALNILVMATEALSFQVPGDEDGQLLNSLASALPFLVQLLQEAPTLPFDDRNEQLKGIVTLLAEISSTSSELRNEILQRVDSEIIKQLFDEIFNPENKKAKSNDLIIQLLNFVSTMATYREDWMSVYMELLSRRLTLAAVALAILDGEKAVKYQALRLVGSAGWGKDSLASLCTIMTDLRPGIEAPVEAPPPDPNATVNFTENVNKYVSEARINTILENLQNTNLSEASTSAVMELYEYKLAAMSHSERRVQSALEAADNRCVGLNHQLAQLKSEVKRLHDLLMYGQQSMEGVAGEKKDLMDKLEKLSMQNEQQKSVHSRKIHELTMHLKDFEKTLKDQNSQLKATEAQLMEEKSKVEELRSALEEKEAESEAFKCRLEVAIKECEEMSVEQKKTEESLQKAEAKNCEYQAQISDFKAENEELRKSLTQSMQENSQKEEVIADYSKKIHYLEQIREAVINVAGRKDKF